MAVSGISRFIFLNTDGADLHINGRSYFIFDNTVSTHSKDQHFTVSVEFIQFYNIFSNIRRGFNDVLLVDTPSAGPLSYVIPAGQYSGSMLASYLTDVSGLSWSFSDNSLLFQVSHTEDFTLEGSLLPFLGWVEGSASSSDTQATSPQQCNLGPPTSYIDLVTSLNNENTSNNSTSTLTLCRIPLLDDFGNLQTYAPSNTSQISLKNHEIPFIMVSFLQQDGSTVDWGDTEWNLTLSLNTVGANVESPDMQKIYDQSEVKQHVIPS